MIESEKNESIALFIYASLQHHKCSKLSNMLKRHHEDVEAGLIMKKMSYGNLCTPGSGRILSYVWAGNNVGFFVV